jgi:hypothetical protein
LKCGHVEVRLGLGRVEFDQGASRTYVLDPDGALNGVRPV